jgi:phosphoglycerate-specific signal transduction histidine kinase
MEMLATTTAAAHANPSPPDSIVSAAVRLVAARLADELSSPLTSLSLRLELMLAETPERAGQATLMEDLHALDRSARRLVQIVKALRCYSADGLADLHPFRLNQLVPGAVAAAGVSGASVALDPEDPLILGDATTLERFLVRVLAGAGEPSGHAPAVRLQTTAAEDEPYLVTLTISGVDGTPDLAGSISHLLAEQAGALDVRPLDGRAALVLTFPRMTPLLPSAEAAQ